MFHHIGIYVKNMEKSKNFYIEILKTIGYDYDGNNIEIVCDK